MTLSALEDCNDEENRRRAQRSRAGVCTFANARWSHDGGWGWGAGAAGFAAGALIGGALALWPYYYGPPAYGYEPAPVYPSAAGAYCEQRFRSYDPISGTYLG